MFWPQFPSRSRSSQVITNSPDCDEPEDVIGGLMMLANQPWAGTSRTVIHIADAPCHGTGYHGERALVDRFPDGKARPEDPAFTHLFLELKDVHKVSTDEEPRHVRLCMDDEGE